MTMVRRKCQNPKCGIVFDVKYNARTRNACSRPCGYLVAAIKRTGQKWGKENHQMEAKKLQPEWVENHRATIFDVDEGGDQGECL